MDELIVPSNVTDIKPIRDIIYEYLRRAIMDGVIKPGERIVERSYAEKFNASRTPIR
jgi:DNA-binding GntR family transcriptional regulator